MRPLWRCPKCGRPFANRNQIRFCSRLSLREHFKGKSPRAVTLFRKLVKLVRRCGPVKVLPLKTCVVLQVRMGFAAIHLRRYGLDVGIILARRIRNPRFTQIQSLCRRNQIHRFRVHSAGELDREVLAWLREAYRVGQQHHLE